MRRHQSEDENAKYRASRKNEKGASLPLLKGTLDLLVLKALSSDRMHGYGIAVWLEEQSRGALGVEDSAIYQALHRLEGRRLVEAEWGVTENNRRARYYRLTSRGKAALRAEADAWTRYAESVGEILALDPNLVGTEEGS